MFRTAVIATIIIAVFIVGAGLLNVALATETEHDEVYDTLVASAGAWDEDDFTTYLDGLDRLIELSQDDGVSPDCRRFAEIAATSMVLFDAANSWPIIDIVNGAEAYMQALPTARNDCLLAL